MTPIRPLSTPDDDRLFAEHVEPLTEGVIRPVVRRTLHVSLRDNDTSPKNQDALELVGDIQVLILAAFEASGARDRAIEDPRGYSARIATNACYQYLRARFPVRTQQTNKLRYLLSHDNRFELYRCGDGGWMCKVSERSIDNRSTGVLNDRERYTQAVLALLKARTEPVRIEDLVDDVMTHFGVREVVIDAKTDDTDVDLLAQVISPGPSVDRELESVDRLRSAWANIIAMPLRHRKALLLNLRDRHGGLIWALPAAGIASFTEIAETLEMSIDELAGIWGSLPWDDLRIAEHLGLTRQQVINLRQSARAKLLRSEETQK